MVVRVSGMDELTTTTPERRGFAVETPGAYTMAEAVETWQVSARTLRRRLSAGELLGVYKTPGPQGETWRIPGSTLDGLYPRRHVEPTEPPPPPPPPLPTPAERIAAQLTDLLDKERIALAAINESYAVALADAARADEQRKAAVAEAEAERARADALAVELADALKRRRWWGRRK